MTTNKRTYIYKDFQGKINVDTDNYEFPKLYTQDKHGNTRIWVIYIRLIKSASKRGFKTINWDITLENQVPIKPEYLDNVEIPAGTISEVWTETGIIDGELTRSAPTYPIEKNKGRANYRDPFKQALVYARGRYMKKLDEGGITTKSKLNTTDIIANKKYYPMLAKSYADYIKKHKLKFPVYEQSKLDGIRALSYLSAASNSAASNSAASNSAAYNAVQIYTRKLKDYPHNQYINNIRKNLLSIFRHFMGRYKKDESIYLDGEMYNHNSNLQGINHIVRSEEVKEDIDEADQIQYWIYDAFYPSRLDMSFSERTKLLTEIAELINDNHMDANYKDIHTNRAIVIVPTSLINTQDELDKKYSYYIENKYEGMMIRTYDGIYATSNKGAAGLRTADLLKRKEIYTDEYEVIGWTQGVAGKEIGAIIWICVVKIKGREIKFNVTPNLDYKTRYKIYKECKTAFNEIYANRLLTIEYRGLSMDGVPQHAKGIGFRDE